MTWVQQAGWRILVALDGTPQAQRALTYASALAHDTNGTVVMIRAGDPEADSGLFSLRASARRLRQIGLVVDTHVVEGEDAAAVIVAAARSRQVDWIVMATEKSSVVDHLLNGSVTDAVVKAAPVPVLVVPPHCERTISRDHSLRVIVPLDGSKAGERALIPVLDDTPRAREHRDERARAVHGAATADRAQCTDPGAWSSVGHPHTVRRRATDWSVGGVHRLARRLHHVQQSRWPIFRSTYSVNVEHTGDRLNVRLSGGTDLTAGAVLVAAGRTPNTEGLGLEEAGVQRDARGRIIVDPYCRTSARGINAAATWSIQRWHQPLSSRGGPRWSASVTWSPTWVAA